MAVDGIMFEGVSVRVRRPDDYNPAAAAALGPSVPNPALNLGAIGLQPGGMGAQVIAQKIWGANYFLSNKGTSDNKCIDHECKCGNAMNA